MRQVSDTLTLSCRKCGKTMQTPRSEHDYPEAVSMRLDCPDCWNGDFDEPDYFDADGNIVEYDPEEIPARRASSRPPGADKMNHIQHTHMKKVGMSWCGQIIGGLWVFQNIDHAAYAVANEGTVQPCRQCVAAVVSALHSVRPQGPAR